MEGQPVQEYCPRCQVSQPTFPFTEDARTVRRCQVCGFPVETGLTLESAGASLGSPPDVKILCVDDDPLVCRMFGDILRFRGYTVLVAPDGETGLDLAARERPALILLDIMLPGIDGFEVCRLLKADSQLRAIPIIILTAVDEPALNARAFQAGAELALRKPAETGVVLRTIEAALALADQRAAGQPAEEAAQAGRRPPGPSDLGLPTYPVTLNCWTVDGASFRAQLSLHLNAETHAGPETVQDRLNHPDLFLTLAIPGEVPVLFLNKIQLIRVDVAEGGPPDLPDGAEATVEAIQVQLINGEQLTGTVRIEAPVGRRRLSDFLNTQPAFLPLYGADRLHLLHKRFIARILPHAS